MDKREQALDALGQANVIRIERGKLRREVRSSALRAVDYLEETPDALSSVRIDDYLEWIRGVGPKAAAAILAQSQTKSRRKLGDLTNRERRALVDAAKEKVWL